MPVIDLEFNINDRARLRSMVLQLWIQESPGSTGAVSSFRYNVERLADGSRIYLERPAHINKGADFRVLCENFIYYKNGKPKPPSHPVLITELQKLVAISPAHKQELLSALRRVWECEDVNIVVRSLTLFQGNLDAERTLKLAKWLFIEQDITDWSYSGRAMLRGGIEQVFGPLP